MMDKQFYSAYVVQARGGGELDNVHKWLNNKMGFSGEIQGGGEEFGAVLHSAFSQRPKLYCTEFAPHATLMNKMSIFVVD